MRNVRVGINKSFSLYTNHKSGAYCSDCPSSFMLVSAGHPDTQRMPLQSSSGPILS